MMAALFLITCIIFGLILLGYRRTALVLLLINLILALGIFWHHVDTVININL